MMFIETSSFFVFYCCLLRLKTRNFIWVMVSEMSSYDDRVYNYLKDNLKLKIDRKVWNTANNRLSLAVKKLFYFEIINFFYFLFEIENPLRRTSGWLIIISSSISIFKFSILIGIQRKKVFAEWIGQVWCTHLIKS